MLILEPKRELEITPTRYFAWRRLIASGEALNWNRDGLVRRVTTAALSNALSLYRDCTLAVATGRMVELPKHVRFIYWEQADDVDAGRSGSRDEAIKEDAPAPDQGRPAQG